MDTTIKIISDIIFSQWFDQASRVGRSNVEDVVADVVEADVENCNFEVPEGGHQIELVIDLAIILAAAQLLLSAVDFGIRETRYKEEERIELIVKKIQAEKKKELELSPEKIGAIAAEVVRHLHTLEEASPIDYLNEDINSPTNNDIPPSMSDRDAIDKE
jgi:hypothetical protein